MWDRSYIWLSKPKMFTRWSFEEKKFADLCSKGFWDISEKIQVVLIDLEKKIDTHTHTKKKTNSSNNNKHRMPTKYLRYS